MGRLRVAVRITLRLRLRLRAASLRTWGGQMEVTGWGNRQGGCETCHRARVLSQVKSAQVSSSRVKWRQVESSRVKWSQVKSSRATSSHVESRRVTSSHVESRRVTSKSRQVTSSQVESRTCHGAGVWHAAWGMKASAAVAHMPTCPAWRRCVSESRTLARSRLV